MTRHLTQVVMEQMFMPNNQFVSVLSKKNSTSGPNFTYKNEKNEDVVVNENWIIHWSARCERKKLNAVLKRKVTYFITKCPEYLWLNKMALVEFTGVDSDEHSNEKPHANDFYKGDAYQRTSKAVIANGVDLKFKGCKSNKIFNQLQNVPDPSEGLSNRHQLYNAVSRKKRKDLGETFGSSGTGQSLTVFSHMLMGEKSPYGAFVRKHTVDSKQKPSFVCYRDWQLEYMKKVCSFDPEWCSITNEDKTYNLTIMLLTHFAFLGLDFVLEKDHRVHPIIPGKLHELAHLLTLNFFFFCFLLIDI